MKKEEDATKAVAPQPTPQPAPQLPPTLSPTGMLMAKAGMVLFPVLFVVSLVAVAAIAGADAIGGRDPAPRGTGARGAH